MTSLAAQERRFALSLLAPALVVLLLTTSVPLVYLAWTSLQRIDLAMPWMSGFAGLGNYAKMGGDPRFWSSLSLTAIYTASTVALQVIIGLSLALLVMSIPRGQGLLRVAAILPIVLAPVVVGLILGPVAEAQLRRALQISLGDPLVLVQSPMAATLLGIALLALIAPFVLKGMSRFKASED